MLTPRIKETSNSLDKTQELYYHVKLSNSRCHRCMNPVQASAKSRPSSRISFFLFLPDQLHLSPGTTLQIPLLYAAILGGEI